MQYLEKTKYSEDFILKIEEAVHQKYLKKYPEHMSRYLHILGVAKMAKELALKNNVDPSCAYICGLCHDYYKYESNEELEKILENDSDILACRKTPVLYHAYASSVALKKIFHIEDSEMISAVKYHVFGKENMTMLEKIILISDYTEPTRTYKDCIEVRNILYFYGMDEAIYESTKRVVRMLKEKKIEPDSNQLLVLKEYEEKIRGSNMEKIDLIISSLKKVNPLEISVYDLEHKNPFFDYIIVASVDSVRQANASVNYIKENEELKNLGFKIKNFEGLDSGWVLIDGFDILIHVFTSSERSRIDIDKLYLDYKKLTY